MRHYVLCLAVACALMIPSSGLKADDSAITVSLGAGMPVSPNYGYDDAYDNGFNVGAQYRRYFGNRVSAVGEVAYSKYDNSGVTLFRAQGFVDTGWELTESVGGDLSRVRLTGGVAYGTRREEGINAYGKATMGLFHHGVEDITDTLTQEGTGIVVYNTIEPEGSNDFGLNFGGGVEFPLEERTSVFAGFDLDVIFGSPDFMGSAGFLIGDDTMVDMTVKGGFTIHF